MFVYFQLGKRSFITAGLLLIIKEETVGRNESEKLRVPSQGLFLAPSRDD